MENSKKKMLREVSHDRLTPKKRDDLVQSEIFGDFEEDELEYDDQTMIIWNNRLQSLINKQ